MYKYIIYAALCDNYVVCSKQRVPWKHAINVQVKGKLSLQIADHAARLFPFPCSLGLIICVLPSFGEHCQSPNFPYRRNTDLLLQSAYGKCPLLICTYPTVSVHFVAVRICRPCSAPAENRLYGVDVVLGLVLLER